MNAPSGTAARRGRATGPRPFGLSLRGMRPTTKPSPHHTPKTRRARSIGRSGSGRDSSGRYVQSRERHTRRSLPRGSKGQSEQHATARANMHNAVRVSPGSISGNPKASGKLACSSFRGAGAVEARERRARLRNQIAPNQCRQSPPGPHARALHQTHPPQTQTTRIHQPGSFSATKPARIKGVECGCASGDHRDSLQDLLGSGNFLESPTTSLWRETKEAPLPRYLKVH